MKSKHVVQIAIAAILPVLAGCGTAQTGGAPQAIYTPGPGYAPAPVVKLHSPPVLHFWAPSGIGVIQAGLMNHMR